MIKYIYTPLSFLVLNSILYQIPRVKNRLLTNKQYDILEKDISEKQ